MDITEIEAGTFVSKKLFQFLCSLVAATGSFTTGMLIGWSSACLDKIRADERFEGITEEQLYWIASLFPVGAIFSGSFVGLLTKHFGGQRSMLMLCVPTVLAWLLILFATNVYMIYAGRLLLGIFNGAQFILVPIYVSEIVEENIRGMASAPSPLFSCLGILFMYAVGCVATWGTLTLIATGFPAVFMCLLFFIPETPTYLLAKGKKAKAIEVLMWLRGATDREDVEEEFLSVEANQETEKCSLKDFLAPETLKPVVLVLALMAIQQSAGLTCVLFFASRIFEASKTNLDAELCSVIMGIVNVISAVIFIFTVEKLGRKLLLILSFVTCALSLATLGWYFYMMNTNMDTSQLGVVAVGALLLYIFSSSMGFAPLPWILNAELLPRKVVGFASSLSSTVNWLFCFVTTNTFGTLISVLEEHGSFWLFAGFCIFGAVLTFGFIPETKGKKLEEIQVKFRT